MGYVYKIKIIWDYKQNSSQTLIETLIKSRHRHLLHPISAGHIKNMYKPIQKINILIDRLINWRLKINMSGIIVQKDKQEISR